MFGEGEPHQSINFTATTFPSNKSIHVKSDMVFCPVRSQPGDALDNITMFLSVYIPTFLGPVITFLIFLITFPCTNIISREEIKSNRAIISEPYIQPPKRNSKTTFKNKTKLKTEREKITSETTFSHSNMINLHLYLIVMLQPKHMI